MWLGILQERLRELTWGTQHPWDMFFFPQLLKTTDLGTHSYAKQHVVSLPCPSPSSNGPFSAWLVHMGANPTQSHSASSANTSTKTINVTTQLAGAGSNHGRPLIPAGLSVPKVSNSGFQEVWGKGAKSFSCWGGWERGRRGSRLDKTVSEINSISRSPRREGERLFGFLHGSTSPPNQEKASWKRSLRDGTRLKDRWRKIAL